MGTPDPFPADLDPAVTAIVARTARLFLAQWEVGTPVGDRCQELLLAAAAEDEERMTTEFYRLAFQDALLLGAFRRAVATAVYLEWGIAPGDRSS